MRNLFSIIIIVFAATFGLSAQESKNNCKSYGSEKAYVYSVSKDGIKSNKDCLRVIVCDHAIEFRATATSVMTMYKINEHKWETEGGEVVNVSVQSDGRIAYWVSDKKAFVLFP
jgi:hypothetical protein